MNKPSDIAYVIYTSGSTGHPKGVMVEHRNVVSLMWSGQHLFGFGSADVWVMAHSYGFDFSVWEMYGALLYGGRLVVPDWETVRDVRLLYNLVIRERVTVLNQTPGAFYNFLSEDKHREDSDLADHLRYVIFGGDALDARQLRSWSERYGTDKIHLVNMYGITETTVHVSYYELTSSDIYGDSSSGSVIGRSIPGVVIYILDGGGQLLPPGVAGELYVGGTGVSRGYLNNTALTSSRFSADPFVSGGMLYRTGDIGRWDSSGKVEYLGRSDSQVKLRGYRIELGEIERVLGNYAGVEKAVVLLGGEESSRYLVGYYTSGALIDEGSLRSYAGQHLPVYMVPVYLIRVDRFGLTGNGKLDRESLPDPVALGLGESDSYVAPGTDLEEQLAEIWKEVLNRDRVGVTDNFFELGGDSIKAIRITSYIMKNINIRLELNELFESPTIAAIAQKIEIREKTIYEQIPVAKSQEYYPLTNAQKRFWIMDQLEDNERSTYNISAAYSLKGDIDSSFLDQAFQILIDRHESLRTTFVTLYSEPYQKINKLEDIAYKLEYIDLTRESEKQARIKKLCSELMGQKFDLSTGPLLKTNLYKLDSKDFVFFLVLHHIIADEWSLEILVKEILGLYNGFVTNNPYQLNPLKIQYKDFAVWQHDLLQQDSVKKLRNYWVSQFNGDLPVLALDTDYKRPEIRKNNGAMLGIMLEKDTTYELNNYAQSHGASLFMCVTAIINVLLYRYTGQKDIIIGTTTAGRDRDELENQIGFYLNILAIRNILNPEDSFESTLKNVRDVIIGAFRHQSYPFDRLLEDLDLPRDFGRMPLFDVAISYHNVGNLQKEQYKFSEFSVGGYYTEIMVSTYDLVFHFEEFSEGLSLQIEYNTDLFVPARIEKMLKHFKNIANGIDNENQLVISKIRYLEETEINRIKNLGSEVPSPGFSKRTITEEFEHKAALFSENTALVFRDRSLSYCQLNEKANQFGHYLRSKYNIKNDEIIAISIDQSDWLVIALLGILKSGAAYLPVDPETPSDRIAFILKDARVNILITDSENMFNDGLRNQSQIELVVIDIQQEWLQLSTDNLGHINRPTDLAYVIYTSGSTGHPKGVMIEHRNALNMSLAVIDEFSITEKDRILQFAAASFDASVYEVLTALHSGAAIVIINKPFMLAPSVFIAQLKSLKVSIATFPPTYLATFEEEDFSFLRILVTAGEAANVRQLSTLSKKLHVYNAYGPSECAVCTTIYRVKPADHLRLRIPIGTPIGGVKIYILSNQLQMVPIGVEGEICISGAGLARGYMNQHRLTDERFVTNPFEPGAKLYKTGDRGKWTDDGTMEYTGRQDLQIKLRGYRIEVEEVEKVMESYEHVLSAAVVLKEAEGNKFLAGYYNSRSDISSQLLRDYLELKIPKYMIPAHLIQLNEFVLTTNGKIDKRRLPEPFFTLKEANAESDAPLNENQLKLLDIWKELLPSADIGLDSDFFELGGDSIKAIQAATRIHREFGVAITLNDIFVNTTIRTLELLVEKAQLEPFDQIAAAPQQPNFVLSHAQLGLWIIDRLGKDQTAYNLPMAFEMQGALDRSALQHAFKQLIDRHEILRTRFVEVDGGPRQEIIDVSDYVFNIEHEDLREVAEKERLALVIASREAAIRFDLSIGPIIRCRILRLKEEKTIILLTLHHIIADGWSMNIFFKELISFYKAFIDKKEIYMSPLKIQYKDFAEWQHNCLSGNNGQYHRKYWLNQFSDRPLALNLPTDYERKDVLKYHGKRDDFYLNGQEFDKINAQLKDSAVTSFMIFLSAINTLLYSYTNQTDIVLGTPLNARSHPDLENQIGMYLNLLPLRFKYNAYFSFEELLENVKMVTLNSYEHDIYPFDLLIQELKIDRNLNRFPLFDILIQTGAGDTINLEKQDFSLEIEELSFDSNTSKFDLTFNFSQSSGQIEISIEYNTDLFTDNSIKQMGNDLTELIRIVANDCSQKLSDIKKLLPSFKNREHSDNAFFVTREISEDF
ncbi:amino acid adenylation domain-containing protein [Mucilaginibacter sp. RCC_168]|uniref:amino acid adenylation domain-containing protein n=1 Tax=Mucilaginibacter sp. RCC_168 TaxID=3239221 RepID=UPI0035249ABF